MITLTFETWEEFDEAISGIVSLETALAEGNQMMFYNGFNLLIDLLLVILAYEVGMYFGTKRVIERTKK